MGDSSDTDDERKKKKPVNRWGLLALLSLFVEINGYLLRVFGTGNRKKEKDLKYFGNTSR